MPAGAHNPTRVLQGLLWTAALGSVGVSFWIFEELRSQSGLGNATGMAFHVVIPLTRLDALFPVLCVASAWLVGRRSVAGLTAVLLAHVAIAVALALDLVQAFVDALGFLRKYTDVPVLDYLWSSLNWRYGIYLGVCLAAAVLSGRQLVDRRAGA